ncbi:MULTISPECIES: 4'-phosphopantetheinyl transferase superfamily protein [Actinoplanes]|uniref:holo-ACP synthase n=1 Tax=Actinoplanes TaxID=1865 RepID=UPI000695C5D4|nr:MULTISPECIES: 4'-phosphopantetheinyl transferase superfamily protein [Actinoplanes]GLY02721.1 hypothetical protein Acsp01_31000 [Actinoplanes sp. NBRC 101535]
MTAALDPPVVAIGTDVLGIAGVGASLDRFGDRYLRHVYTSEEIRACEAKGVFRGTAYAARFAAKEAVIKVLGSTEVSFREVEIDLREGETGREPTGGVRVQLHRRAAVHAERCAIATIQVCVGYGREYAMATAIGFAAAPAEAAREGSSS